jgi:hypothetical protein
MIRMMLLLSVACGCSAPVADYSGQCVSAIAISCAIAEGSSTADPVTPAFKCARCEDKGWFYTRDTGLKQDCPECDADPLSKAAATIINDPQPTPELAPPPAEPNESARQEAPAVIEWLTWPEASALSKETGRPVLVLQKFRNPADDAACLPCQRLKKTLADPAAFKAFAELGIPCLGYADEWQAKGGDLVAPMLALVQPDAAPSDPVQSLSGFRVAPADALLNDLRKWINALPK